MQYYVVYERGDGGGWGAYLPDLPGCVAVGETLEAVRELIRGAIELHLKGVREDGVPIPQPSAESGELVEVSAA